MAQAATQVRGLAEFRSQLKAADKTFPRELAKAHRKIGNQVAGTAQSIAKGTSRQMAAASGAIKGRGTQRQASVAISGGARIPFADGAFWGAEAYPQFPPWVGNTWAPGVAGQGPYAINDAVAEEIPETLDTFSQMITDLYDRAFPD